jgi:hypothetical protein
MHSDEIEITQTRSNVSSDSSESATNSAHEASSLVSTPKTTTSPDKNVDIATEEVSLSSKNASQTKPKGTDIPSTSVYQLSSNR